MKDEMLRADFGGAPNGHVCSVARFLFSIFFIPSAP
jgi:hypothetical protein